MALVILRSTAPRVEKKLGQGDVGIPAVIGFLVVHEASKSYQGLFHLLVSIEPFLLARADIRNPTVCKFFGGVVQAQVLPVRKGVVIDRGFDEISGDVALMVAAVIGRPAFRPVL